MGHAKKKYALAVIVPVANDIRILDCLESLREAKEDNIEVILVLSNVKNNLIKKIIKYKTKLNIQIIKDSSYNIGKLRNIGIKKSKANIFYFVDVDCKIYPEALQRAIKNGQKNLVTIGKVHFVGKSWISSLDARLREARYDSSKKFAYCPNLVVKKELFERVGFFDESYNYGSDGEFSYRILHEGIIPEYDSSMKLEHDGTKAFFSIFRTWIKYGQGRYKRLKKASFQERLKGLFSPNLFDYREKFSYNLICGLCLIGRWIGWLKESIRGESA